MQLNARIVMHTVNYIAFCIALFAASLLNPDTRFLLLLFSFAFLSNYTIHTFFLNEKQMPCLLFSLADLAFVCVIALLDQSGASLFLAPFLIGDAILDLHSKWAAAMVCIDFGGNAALLGRFFHGRMPLLLPCLFLCAAAFFLFSLIFILIKRLQIQNKQLEQALRESMVEKMQAQARRRDLETVYKQAVQASAVNERNRIAREIHDTVGHTLTTVLVELEASRRLTGRDPDRAAEKLALAQGQVRDGLQAIRTSVRVLEDDRPLLNPYDAMETLLHDCVENTGISITTHIDKRIGISMKTGEVLYACLREGLTNSLRHGHCTAVVFTLRHEGGGICFSLSDNGAGATVVTPGFGLRAMQSRIEQADGSLHIQTEKGQGFSIHIKFPT